MTKSYYDWIKEHPEHDPGPKDNQLIDEWMRRFIESIIAYNENYLDEVFQHYDQMDEQQNDINGIFLEVIKDIQSQKVQRLIQDWPKAVKIAEQRIRNVRKRH